jgi:hypothetical protein
MCGPKVKRLINLKVDFEKEKEIQLQVDNGHQPWRLEASDVAYVAVRTNVDKSINYKNCSLKSETSNEAKVLCKGASDYLVNLKRLIRPDRPDGIWTAISIEIK